MNDNANISYGDPISAPFWEAAARRELMIQRCRCCASYQFYARPFCILCDSDDVEWVAAKGTGTVYSMTTVRRKLLPGFDPPYIVAIVELDEGSRMLTNITSKFCRIGSRVRVAWKDRDDAPPLPVFETIEEEHRGKA